MSLRTTLFPIILLFCTYGMAQVSDDFSDGDFTSNPVWSGDVSLWQITSGQLNSNGPAATAELYLSTPNDLLDNTVWEFYVKMGFAPSGSNRIRVYLVSNQADLEGALDGYYIEIGQTGDDYVLLKRSDSGVGTTLLSGTTVFSSQVRVKIIRTSNGEWTLLADHSGGQTFTEEGSITENTYTSNSYFGVVVNHTSSRNTSFFFDDFQVEQVMVDTLITNSSTELTIDFNQPLPQSEIETISNYSISGITITSATQDAADPSKVTLTLDGSTPLLTSAYTLSVSTDLTKNDAISYDFNYTQLELSQLLTLSETEIQLVFNDKLDQTSAEMESNYSIDNGIGQPLFATLDAEDQTRVILTLGSALVESTTFQLDVSGIENSSGNSTLSDSQNFTFVIPVVIDTLYATSEKSCVIVFNKSLNESIAETVNNYSLDGALGTPTSAVVLSDDKSVALTFDLPFGDQTYTLTINNVEDVDGNVIDDNSSDSFDYLGLEMSSLSQEGNDAIHVYFNQEIDDATFASLSNYSLSEIGEPTSVELVSSNHLLLTWDQLFNSSYELSITGLTNASGNSSPAQLSGSVSITTITSERHLIINEFLADPTPSIGLPEVEFVEIYNTRDYSINIENFTLDGQTIGAFQIPGEGYVVLTDESSLGDFVVSNKVGVSSMGALTNSGDQIVLKDQFGNLIDSINYVTTEWFSDSEKSAGGYSLERVDPLQPCSDESNWIGTENEDGGTPGEQNSVFNDVDETAPNLVSVEVIGGDTLLVVFSEPIDESTITTSSFDLDGFTFSSLIKVNYTEYYLVLSSDLTSEVTHSLIIENISDCRGNELTSQSFEFYYDVESPVLDRIDLISETELLLVFNEAITESTAENESNYSIDGLLLYRATLQDTVTRKVLLSFDNELTLGASYTLTYSNLQDTLNNVSSEQTMDFMFTSDIDTVWVETSNVMVLKYKEVPSPTAADIRNYFLSSNGSNPDTIIHKDDIGITEFRLSFSENFEENRALKLYVNNVFSSDHESRLATPAVVFTYDTRAPTINEVLAQNDSQAVVRFNEAIDTISALKSFNYLLDGADQPVKVEFVSASEVKLTFQTKFVNDHTLTIQRIEDLSGNQMSSARRIDFAYDINPPIVIASFQIAPNQIQLQFDEPLEKESALAVENYVTNSISPGLVQILGPDSSTVNLTFDSLPQVLTLTLFVTSIEDQLGNKSGIIEQTVNTLQPRLVSLAASSKQSLLLTYSQAVSGADVLSNYLLEGFSLTSVRKLTDQNYQLFISDDFEDGDSLHLEVNNVKGVNDENLQDTDISSFFEVGLEGFGMINDRVLYLDFLNDLQEVNSSNFEVEGETISLVSWDSEDKSLVRLTLANEINANATAVVAWNGLVDVYDRTIPEFLVGIFNDKTDPYLVRYESDFNGRFLLTYSEAMDQSDLLSVNKYNLEGYGNPKSTILENDSSVILDFDNQLVRNGEYSLHVDPLADLAGNFTIEESLQLTYHPPALAEYQDVIITEIMADPSPVVGLPDVEYIELYNNSNRTFDLKGMVLADGTTEVGLPSYLLESDSYVVLVSDNNRDLFEHENVLDVDGFPALTNSGESLTLKTILNELIDSLHYESSWYHDSVKDEGGYSLERISFTGTCSDEQNWAASNNETGGTPGEQNSVYREGADGVAPTVTDFTKISTSEVLIEFSEPMDSLSLLDVAFSIEETNLISREVSGDNHEFLSIRFNELDVGSYYEALLSGARDCTGTPMNDTTFVFGFGRDPLPGDLKITEVMADPDPAIGLPSAEYIEIYNNTDELLSLANVRFRDSNSSRLLGEYLISDSAYVIVTSADASQEFATYGEVIGVSDWPSLTNSGETISLATEVTIDEVSYEDDWFLDPEKKSGGYALEMINPNSACPTSSNWSESQDVSGGTPGRQNSIYSDGPDGTKPLVTSFEVIDAYTLRFTFNEVMDSLSLISANVEGAIARNRSVTDDRNQELTVELLAEIDAATEQIIRLSNVTDCSGNSIDPIEFTVALGVAPEYNELIITEIMADPDPAIGLPSAEYLELYNRSTSVLSLEGVQLMDATDTVDLPAVTILPGEYLVLTTTSRVGDFDPSIQVVGVSGWSALNNSGERLSLVYRNQEMFEVSYDLSWHVESAKDGGYSLEMKDVNNPCGGKENWTSSSSLDGGTPGLVNAATEGVPDNFGPKLITARALNNSVVELEFDEPLGVNSPANTVLIFEPSLAVRSISFGETNHSLYVYLEDNLVKNQPVQIEVFGTIDCLGNAVQTNSASFVLPDEAVVGDVVLNEVLFNPRTEGVDFIELLNTSSKYIDLYEWGLGNASDAPDLILEHYVLKPTESVAISTDTITVKNQYPLMTKNQLQVSSIPSMPNTNGEVLVFNSSGKLMDQFTYDEDFHLSFLESVDGVSLERIDPKSETQDSDNWTSASSAVGFATPGALNSQQFDVPLATATVSIQPKVFVPGNRSAAHQSFTTINYQLDQTGQFANVTVYNQMGQPVADLARGESLGTTGFFRWDGTSYGGSVVRRGYYVVLFELYDNSGNTQTLKQTVVVGK